MCRIERWLNDRANLLIACLTGALLLVAALQVWIYISTYRAFIAPLNIGLRGLTIKADTPLVYDIDYKNTGQSTGDIRDARLATIVSPELAHPSKYPSMRKTFLAGPTLAGVTMNSTFVPFDPATQQQLQLTQTQVAMILAGQTHLYVWGYFDYRDIFRLPIISNHRTAFCMMYQPTNDAGRGMFQACGDPDYQYAN